LLCRYKKARARGKESLRKAVEEDQELLGTFGMGLLSVDNGLRVVLKKSLRDERINPWDVIEVNSKLWGWLRPLLVELVEHRRGKATSAEVASGSGLNGHHAPLNGASVLSGGP